MYSSENFSPNLSLFTTCRKSKRCPCSCSPQQLHSFLVSCPITRFIGPSVCSSFSSCCVFRVCKEAPTILQVSQVRHSWAVVTHLGETISVIYDVTKGQLLKGLINWSNEMTLSRVCRQIGATWWKKQMFLLFLCYKHC